MSKKLILAAALTLGFGTTSCLGPNKIFNDLHDWNKQATDNEWANEAIFVGMLIIPVYKVAYIADVVLFNSITFWEGQ